jgi:homoserine O-acetyltransferase
LGSPGSSAPSTSSLKTKFPEYTIRDLVNAQKTLITEKFKIKRLKGVIGSSMGGFQTLRWAVDYPNLMDFIIPIATSYEFKGQIYGVYNLMNNILKGDPDYKNGDYEEQPKRVMEIAAILTHLWSFSPQYFKDEFKSNDQLMKSFDERIVEIGDRDANDVIWRNKSILSFNIKSDLSKIRTKALVIGIRQDQFFPPETDVIPLGELIENALIFVYDSNLGHYGCVGDIKKAEKPIRDFLVN